MLRDVVGVLIHICLTLEIMALLHSLTNLPYGSLPPGGAECLPDFPVASDSVWVGIMRRRFLGPLQLFQLTSASLTLSVPEAALNTLTEGGTQL